MMGKTAARKVIDVATKKGVLVIDAYRVVAIEEDKGKVYLHAEGIYSRVELNTPLDSQIKDIFNNIIRRGK